MNKEAYQDYLHSDYWQDYRRAELRRANYRCESCGEGGCILHVHHLHYETLGQERSGIDTVVYCEGCHLLAHPELFERKLTDFLNGNL